MIVGDKGWFYSTARTPARGISFMVISLGAALLFFIVYAGMSLNRAARSSEVALLDSAISVKVNRTLMEQKSIAFWDDVAMRTDAQALNTRWFDREVGSFLAEGYGHDEVYILDDRDRPVYAYARNRHARLADFGKFLPKVTPMLREIRSGVQRPYRRRDQNFAVDQKRYVQLTGVKSAKWAANLLVDGKQPVIVSIITIVPPFSALPAHKRPHLVVSVVRLDKAWFDLAGRSLQFGGMVMSHARLPDWTEIKADDGQFAVSVKWDYKSPGRLLIARLLPLAVLLLALAGIYCFRIFRSLSQAHNLLRAQEANARFQALHDGLSQLPNRRLFLQTLAESLGEAEAAGTRICVAYLDVDHFKNVNDAIGHGAGDALVRQIGPRLLAELRQDDLLARLGGDEFAVLRHMRENDDADALGRSIMLAFRRPFDIGPTPLEVTCSIGIAVSLPGEMDPQRLVQDADISLYRAKDQGRNQFVVFHQVMADQVKLRHELENDLRTAIGTDQIVMHYQPIISARSGKVTSVEALVRWQHPARGLIDPSRFISIAEQSGLMVPLGDYIFERVMIEAAQLEAHVHIAVNLSPMQLRTRTLPDRLLSVCRQANVDPKRVVLEVTESMLIDAKGASTDVYHRLQELGFRTALDDFGTGYSSLGYLHRFSFDKIKIDRSFVARGSLAQMRPIVEAIVHIGRGLRMDIVAEGVETASELAMVRALGCTEVQGYVISKPLPFEELVAFLKEPAAPPQSNQTLYLAAG
jgi:diguanylate cyclase (GGDEF)-like protein